MRCLWLSLILLASACSQHNPDSCCRTQEQCTQFGLDGITGCDTGKVCDDNGACIASECTVSADCTDPSLPICENNLCIAKCTMDNECSTDAPHCASDGACVACVMDSDCDSSVPVCDMTTRSCRGCVADSECASGACLAATSGTCADSGNILWVSELGHDTGDCPHTSPCLTLSYAISKIVTFHNVIHVDGTVSAGTDTIVEGGPIYIDGSNNAGLTRPAKTLFSLSNQADLTLDGISVASGVGSVVVMSAGNLRLRKSTLGLSNATDAITMTGGELTIDRTTFDSGSNGGQSAVNCTGGKVTMTDSTVRGFEVATTNCETVAQRNTFYSSAETFFAKNEKLLLENNLFTSTDADADGAAVLNLSTGSIIRFNTWADTSTSPLGGNALKCDASTVASSNIFVWGPQALAGCSATYSSFDDATSEPPSGHNIIASPTALFADFGNSDFHLAATSPARGAADPAQTVSDDHDGKARPNPTGTTADMGAYEAP